MDTSKVIRGVVNSGRYTVTAPIVKEDYGLKLKIEGVELPSTYQVDFSNEEHHGTSVTMIGNADGVLIPRQFIDSGKDVFAFLYHVGENFGRTVYKFRIPNKLRPDRTNEEPTPEEQSVIDQAIGALNDAVAQTAEDRENADASAQSAYESADEAQQARDTAQTYANNAQTSATSAQTSASQASASATASAQSASQSAQIKADVEDLVDDAQGYASASAQSASASANSASQAQGYAQSASASAQSASTSASDALTYANTASSKATEASTSAQTASTKATESAQSASQALTYKTDAESAKTDSQTAQGLAESARDTAVSAKTDAESARDDAETARDEAQSAVASISGALAEKAPVITDTASGSIASFSDGADNLPLKSLVVDINPIQDLSHGDPSPENICPISGWTSVDVERAGKNLLKPSMYGHDSTQQIYTRKCSISVSNDVYVFVPTGDNEDAYFGSISFVETISSDEFERFIAVRVEPNKSYAISLSNTVFTKNYVQFFNKSLTRLRVNGANSVEFLTTSVTITSPSEAYWLVLRIGTTTGTAGTAYSTTIQVEQAETATTYEPYSGQTYSVDWETEAGTVYGGKLDVLSGELTVDRAMIASYNGETLPSTWISDRDAYAQGATPTTGAQVVYKLATPITIQLTPNQVNSLLGVNNLWADSGDTEVEYRADTKAYIAKKIAEAIASLT